MGWMLVLKVLTNCPASLIKQAHLSSRCDVVRARVMEWL